MDTSRRLALVLVQALLLGVSARAQIPAPEEETEAEEGGLSPESVARESERFVVTMPDIDVDLVEGNARARELDAKRRRLAWLGTVQGGLVVVLLPLAVRTIRDTHDPVIRTVTSSWIAVGMGVVSATGIIGAHASLHESRLYRCRRQQTSRRLGRTAMAFATIPGLSLMSPLFAHLQHQESERTRMCELEESVRARRIRIVPVDDDTEER